MDVQLYGTCRSDSRPSTCCAEAMRFQSHAQRAGEEEMLAHVGNRTAVVQSVAGPVPTAVSVGYVSKRTDAYKDYGFIK